jgi:hypothetical protein
MSSNKRSKLTLILFEIKNYFFQIDIELNLLILKECKDCNDLNSDFCDTCQEADRPSYLIFFLYL